MTTHTLHLILNGTHRPGWTDAHLAALPVVPYLHLGSGARVRVLLTNTDGDAVVSASGLTDILLEVWKGPDLTELLCAAEAVQVATAAPSLSDWTSATGSYYTAEAVLTEEETAAVLASATALDATARTLQAWMEIRGTFAGQNVLLGAGPVLLLRGSTGGTPLEAGTLYYTAAEVDALLASRPAITVSGGAGSFTLGGTTYYFPVTTVAPS
jgi:hypothetical protein